MGLLETAPARYETVNGHGQLVSIQYLRGFAALSVVIAHALQWPLTDHNLILLKTGRLGVEVFFVISGFIMTMIAGSGALRPLDFLARRAIRIAPAYWAATLLTMLVLVAPNHATVPTVEGFIKSLLFIPSVNPTAPLLVLGWTLNYEAFFYLIFASLFFFGSKARTAVLCSLFAVPIAIGFVLQQPSHMQAFYASMNLAGFCLGTVVAQLCRHGVWMRSRTARLVSLAVLPVLVMLFYAIPWDSAERASLPLHLLMSATAVCLVLVGLQLETAGRLPRSAALTYLGNTSYSLYLFHIFAVAGVWAVAKRLFDVQQPLAYLACAVVAFAAGAALGQVGYHLIERPSLAFSRKWRRSPVPA